MKKKFRLVALLLAMVFVFTACGGDKGKETGAAGGKKSASNIIKANNTSEPGSLDPALSTGTHDSWILDHTFEGLMKYDKDGKLVPGMAAEKPEISEDGLTYTFKLRDDIKWSNGDPITANDFEFSWKRLADPETASDYAYQLDYVKGATAFTSGEGKADDVAVKAIDEKTLEVQLNNLTPFFEGLTAFYALFPVNEKVVTENADWAKNAETHVSNGPFKLSEWDHGSKIKIVKNDEYYNADEVKIDGVDFDIIDEKNTEWSKYDKGELDIVVKPTNEIVNKLAKERDAGKEVDLVSGDYIGLEYYNFNVLVEPFDNVKVRKGMSMALNRDIITNKVRQMGDTVAEGIVPFGLLDDEGKEFREANGNLIKEDPVEAKKLFEEGLKEKGMTVEDFNAKNFVLIYNTDETHKKVTQAMQEMWKTTLGAEIQLENMDFQVKLDREKAQPIGDFHLSRSGWVGDFEDPMTMIDLWLTGASNNNPRYSNPEFDKLINSAKTATDAKQRMDDMKAAEKIIMEDVPVMPIYFTNMPYTVKPNIKGVYNTKLSYPVLTYAEIE